MKDETIWQARRELLSELLKEREELSKTIHLLKCDIRQHEKTIKEARAARSVAFVLFGKKTAELNESELRAYTCIINARRRGDLKKGADKKTMLAYLSKRGYI